MLRRQSGKISAHVRAWRIGLDCPGWPAVLMWPSVRWTLLTTVVYSKDAPSLTPQGVRDGLSEWISTGVSHHTQRCHAPGLVAAVCEAQTEYIMSAPNAGEQLLFPLTWREETESSSDSKTYSSIIVNGDSTSNPEPHNLVSHDPVAS